MTAMIRADGHMPLDPRPSSFRTALLFYSFHQATLRPASLSLLSLFPKEDFIPTAPLNLL